jgi:hypothetical protein
VAARRLLSRVTVGRFLARGSAANRGVSE